MAVKLSCHYCTRKWWARCDAKFCSQVCRGRYRQENAKFLTPKIPQSGIKGITWNRRINRWMVTMDGKYLGAFKLLPKAKEFLDEYNGFNYSAPPELTLPPTSAASEDRLKYAPRHQRIQS